MTRIAVTGASGFLGRHVLAALAQMDIEVVAHARSPAPDLGVAKGRRWCCFDLATAPDDAFVQLGCPDIVIHLAWQGLPNYLSERHFQVELPVQYRFLHGLVMSGVPRLVITGTCLEYGMQSGCLHEDLTPMPASPYGCAKDTLRKTLALLGRTISCEQRWLRLFYLYGSGQSPTSLYTMFHAAVARGDRRFDMSPGDQLRDFLKVEDAAAAIVRVALARDVPDIVNICSGAPTTVRNLVERWRAELQADIELNFGALDYPSYEPFAFWGDNTRLCRILGQPPRSDGRPSGSALRDV
jgi:nucleoside-diphosphate-sugar epimerase